MIVDKLPWHYQQWKQNLSLQPEYLYENRYQKWKTENEHRHYPYNEIRQFNQNVGKNRDTIDSDNDEEQSAHWFQEFFRKIL
jgi:hypothetical protein